MQITILKFGGKTLDGASKLEYLKRIVLEKITKKNKVIIVSSAIGRSPYPYSTDALLDLVEGDITPMEMDILASCGETISTVIISDALNGYGIKSRALPVSLSGIITDGNFLDANIIRIDPKNILEYLKIYDVVVIPGFVGIYNNQITTLGRGGSDYTAIALGIRLNAIVEIFKDVDGVYDLDPKRNENAIKYDEITFEKLYDMVLDGSNVISQKAIFLAMKNQFPFSIKSIYDASEGTYIK